MTASERERMRDMIRRAVGRARLPDAEATHPGRFQPPDRLHPGDLIERFRVELTALGGAVHEAVGDATIASIIQTLIPAGPETRALCWDDGALPVPGLSDVLSASGIGVLHQSADTARSSEHRRLMASAVVGVTGADAGLAETGSVVISSGPGRGRLASLLPPIHVALLRRSDVVWSLAELIGSRPALVTAGANFVCITGPSRTADIEHTLSRGVHGPKEVHVILV